MDSKINTGDTGLRVQIDGSRARQAPKTDFGSMVGTGLSRTANAVMDAGQLAAPFIPGGAVLSAAISGVGSLKATASGQTAGSATGSNATGLIGSSGMTANISSSAVTGGVATTTAAGTTGTGTDMMSQMRSFQEMNMSFNMQYLALQEKMQADNRQFSTLSNIMKTKHDTAKNAINNVR
jgi:hypothetical protein